MAVRVYELAKELGIDSKVLVARLGEMGELLVRGQEVVPAAALRAGYAFAHPSLDEALADLARRDWRA